MAATPPLQIASTPDTPPTPLHGAAYDHPYSRSSRRTTRSSTRIASRELRSTPDAPRRNSRGEPSVTTPKLSNQSPSGPTRGLRSPQSTPRHKAERRVQVVSPSSPRSHSSTSQLPPPSHSHLQPRPSSSTTISEGMLPTPVKTPKKKMVPKVDNAARALFQDARSTVDPVKVEPTPKRNRKNKRYNGFSLESFSEEGEDNRGQIQIFTDSRDKVPQVDPSTGNPFMEDRPNGEMSPSRKIAGTTKRRKISGEKKRDPQVEEAIRKDEGMVYVFRGKKVYRRFDDAEDEEEEIDAEDLGLSSHTPNGSSDTPLKTLTRRSIKPTRLFQTEGQKRARELEKEEEAPTDIEDDVNGIPSAETSNLDTADSVPTSKPGRSLRSTVKAPAVTSDGGDIGKIGAKSRRSKKSSPFDSWPRVKSGSRTVSSASKGRKRGATETVEDNVEIEGTESKRQKP
ncbi:uncharacterized protein Z518_06533 [Rhinocladiella mackenziei CBS 650.93]|uniref:Rhinocladiella mackenziei CBS 650.93 unplaced genomic scaffold supercont1.5, whole genome shotgun sequence n=1 Tax=Rhinocladiella mackenziei CBS 650.93 TaxID=1442369 RepID=A0A0D2GXT8_9EURO|nr:uncharacterized protein Z518_06533 [Rhinocladiella mackenziei CBS 650.93]KIX02983.1 hypothetical protein Z518_06533 [Rhinocladiella mackenziei CBS 650.93]